MPLAKRSLVQALFGALIGIAAIVGPLVGGALTTNVTWRWCFYINLPVGAVAMLAIVFFLKDPHRDTTKGRLGDKLKQLDFFGTMLLVPGVICMLLALQWGGQTYPVSVKTMGQNVPRVDMTSSISGTTGASSRCSSLPVFC